MQVEFSAQVLLYELIVQLPLSLRFMGKAGLEAGRGGELVVTVGVGPVGVELVVEGVAGCVGRDLRLLTNIFLRCRLYPLYSRVTSICNKIIGSKRASHSQGFDTISYSIEEY